MEGALGVLKVCNFYIIIYKDLIIKQKTLEYKKTVTLKEIFNRKICGNSKGKNNLFFHFSIKCLSEMFLTVMG